MIHTFCILGDNVRSRINVSHWCTIMVSLLTKIFNQTDMYFTFGPLQKCLKIKAEIWCALQEHCPCGSLLSSIQYYTTRLCTYSKQIQEG